MQLICHPIQLLITLLNQKMILKLLPIQDLVKVEEHNLLIQITLEEMLLLYLHRQIILNRIFMNYVLIDLIDGMSVISSLMIKKELFLKLSKIIHVQIFTMRLSMLALITLWIFYLNWLIQDELITFFLRDILMMICFDMQLFLILL